MSALSKKRKFKDVYRTIMEIDTYDTNAGTVAAALQKLVIWMKENLEDAN